MERVKYSAWSQDYAQEEEDGIKRTSHDYQGPREIAGMWAEWHDISGAEYDIAGHGKTVTVLVRNLETGTVTAWAVTGETLPSYSARPTGRPPCGCREGECESKPAHHCRMTDELGTVAQ